MTHHPHVHMIVSGGGLSLDNARWVAARSNFLVHVNVLARLFRGKMLAMLMNAYDAGELKFFNTHAGLADKSTFKRFIAPLRLQGLSSCCAISPVTPIVSPSRTAVSLPHRRHDCVPLERLSRRRPRPLEDNAASSARVHQAFPA